MAISLFSPNNIILIPFDEEGIVFHTKYNKMIGKFERNANNTFDFTYENNYFEKITINETSINAAFVRLLQRFCVITSYTYKDLSIDQGYRFKYRSWKELADFLMISKNGFIECELEFLISEALARNYDFLRPIYERFILKVCSRTKYKYLAEGLCNIEDEEAFNRSFKNLIGTMWN